MTKMLPVTVALLLVGSALVAFRPGSPAESSLQTTGLFALPPALQNMVDNVRAKLGHPAQPAYPMYHPGGYQPGGYGAPHPPYGQPGGGAGVGGGAVQAPPAASYDCNTGYHRSGWVTGWSEAQMDWCCQNYQKGCRQPRRMNFYMYRAQSDDNYPMNNVNLGDLPGVMWYLHNEVMVSTPRKFNVTRLMRFRVTMMTTPESYAVTKKQFGQYTAFDTGKCTVPGCADIFKRDGYVIGCQNTDSAQGLGNYVSLSSVPCSPPNCKQGTWYSLPGPCLSYYYNDRPDYCNYTEPGGQCQFLYGEGGGVTGFEEAPVSGQKDCTFYAKWAGQIYLNELIGLPVMDGPNNVAYEEYTRWWQAGNAEYLVSSDNGQCTSEYQCDFWAGRNDQQVCADRMRHIQDLFDTKFPFYPKTADLGEAPPCDAA